MSTKYTPGQLVVVDGKLTAPAMPWPTHGKDGEFSSPYIVCQPALYSHPDRITTDENTRRLAACWNAFEGVPTESITPTAASVASPLTQEPVAWQRRYIPTPGTQSAGPHWFDWVLCSKEEHDSILAGPKIYQQVVRALYATPQPAASVANPAWRDMSELNLTSELVWLRKGDSVDGPREPETDDFDSYSQWAPVNPPSFNLPAASVASGGETVRAACGQIIKILAEIVNSSQTDKQFEAELLPRDPVMAKVLQIKTQVDAIYKAVPPSVRPQPRTQAEPDGGV